MTIYLAYRWIQTIIVKYRVKTYKQYWLLFMLNKSVNQKLGKNQYVTWKTVKYIKSTFVQFGGKNKLHNKEKPYSNTYPLAIYTYACTQAHKSVTHIR